MITHKPHQQTWRAIRPSDGAEFAFSPDGLMLVRRAAIEISVNCPREYRAIIQKCIDTGWIQPVAYVKDNEYMWEKLQS
jgi:hypothetical protein